MKRAVTKAAIIAGGASSRMGSPKALLELDGQTLIARTARVLAPLFDEIIVVTRDEATARAANLVAVPDVYQNKGPLGGVHAALKYFARPTFCVACDLPFLSAAVIEFLCEQFQQCDDCEVLAPRVEGRMETLHAIYTSAVLPILEREFENDKTRGAARVLESARVRFIEEEVLKIFDEDLKFLTNINTPEEWRAVTRGE